jgi:hypothetical protein
MRFNYLTNSGGFTRITAYLSKWLDHAEDARIENISQNSRPNIENISQNSRPNPASRGLNRPVEMSELMSRTERN